MVICIIISGQMQKIACDVLYFIVIFGLKKTVIRFFSTYLNSPSERGSEDKDKAKWMICKYFLHSFQRVSIVFVLIASLSNLIFDISTMAYLSSNPRSHVRIFIKSEQCLLVIIISYELWLQTLTIPLQIV